MAKKIILVRHAKSDWSISGQKDHDRTLNQRGHTDAPRMAVRFVQRQINVDALVSSTATRAILTAEYFAEQMKVDKDAIILNEEIYEASARVLLNEINKLDDVWKTVMIFGHNPGFTHIAEYLTAETIGDIPTCAILAIDFEVESWSLISSGMGKIQFYDYPKLHESGE